MGGSTVKRILSLLKHHRARLLIVYGDGRNIPLSNPQVPAASVYSKITTVLSVELHFSDTLRNTGVI